MLQTDTWNNNGKYPLLFPFVALDIVTVTFQTVHLPTGLLFLYIIGVVVSTFRYAASEKDTCNLYETCPYLYSMSIGLECLYISSNPSS